MSNQLARTAKAIHTLFYADEKSAARMATLEASIETDAELAAFQALGIALINFDPVPPEALEAGRRFMERLDREDEDQPKEPSERIAIETHDSDEGHYVRRLLEKMYTKWQGTLDYERGLHVFTFYSPFDEQLRRHTSYAQVSVDGECPDLRARHYVLGPYLLVDDLRTKRKSDDPWRVLNGDLTSILPDGAEGPPALERTK